MVYNKDNKMPYEIYEWLPEKRKRSCYMVVNPQTKKIHAKCSTLKKAKAQVRLLRSLPETEGEGIVEDITNAVSSFVSKTADRISFKKREAGKLPPKSRALLEAVGDEPITSLDIVRTPIESWINKTLQFISGGTWQDAVKSTGYDKLFHLSLWINKKYLLHKIETTTLAKDTNPIKADSETMNVSLGNRQITIRELVERTRAEMGDQRFTAYNPASENCQDFLIAVMKANKLLTQPIQVFIKQDAVQIFSKTPKWTEKIATFITDLGARSNRFVQGEAVVDNTTINELRNIFNVKKKTKTNKMPKKTSTPMVSPEQHTSVKKLTWIEALKKFNTDKGGKWCVPKKGTEEYKKVKSMM